MKNNHNIINDEFIISLFAFHFLKLDFFWFSDPCAGTVVLDIGFIKCIIFFVRDIDCFYQKTNQTTDGENLMRKKGKMEGHPLLLKDRSITGLNCFITAHQQLLYMWCSS